MRVLVTGGAGYIGAHVVRALAEAGHEPIVLDDLRRASAARCRGFELERVALEDGAGVLDVFERRRPEAVVHLAGYISVAESVREPGAYWANNLGAATSLFAAAASRPPQTFLFSSTAAVYGDVAVSPIPEDAPLQPRSPYGASKLAFEQVLHALAPSLGFRSTALRYFNACGAHPDWGVGEAHEPEEHLIPRAARAVLRGEEIAVNGGDYPTPDGTCVRDYVHVQDLAAAHVRAIVADLPGGLSLNCGTGRGHSVREVVQAVGRAAGVEPRVRIGPRRAGDPASLVADPAQLGARTGWRAEHSGLEEIVATALEWERRRGGAA